MLAVDLQEITKTYRGGVQALRGVSLRVRPGEIFGLLGPNGAGKSTLVKIMMTVVRPTRATGTLLGERIGSTSVLERVGYLPEHHRFQPYLTGRQVIDYFGALCKVPRSIRRVRTEELLDLVGMRAWGNHRVTAYSKGMQQRIGIAAALVNDPRLVLLDEPTDGVDPVGRREIRDMLLRLREQGRSVMINSHLLGEVEMIADRVAIMNKGVVVTQGTIEELTRDSHRFEIETEGGPAAIASEFGELVGRSSSEGATRRIFSIPAREAEQVQASIDALRAQGAVIVRMGRTRESLEDLFVRSVVDEHGKALPGANK